MFLVTTRGNKLSHFDNKLAHELIGTQKIKRYWCKKDSIPLDRYDDINWPASKEAQKEQPRGIQRFMGNLLPVTLVWAE